MKNKILQPWVFLLVGVSMTIVSILITNYIISDNNKILKEKKSQVRKIENVIENLWQNSLILEDKKDSLYIMISLQKTDYSLIQNYIKDALQVAGINNMQIPANLDEAFKFVLNEIEKKRTKAFDNIGDSYIKKLDTEEQIEKIESVNKKYSDIALLLYIFGLILVLSKDLVKN